MPLAAKFASNFSEAESTDFFASDCAQPLGSCMGVSGQPLGLVTEQPQEEPLSNEVDLGPNLGLPRVPRRQFRGLNRSGDSIERQPLPFAATVAAKPISLDMNIESRMHDSHVAFESFPAKSQGQATVAVQPISLDKNMEPRMRDPYGAFETLSTKSQHATNQGALSQIATASTLDSFNAVDFRVDTLDSLCSFGQCSDLGADN